MKTAKRQNEFAPASFFVFRTPLLPFSEFLGWSDDLSAPAALDEPARFEEAYARDCVTLRSRLHTIVTRREVRDALFVASPNVIERFHLWTADPETERGRKVEHVLVRYFSRMTGRPTPFGLFAGCSVGATGAQTKLTIKGRGEYGRHTRLDMDYLDALVEWVTREPALRNALNFYPNNSLYRAAGRLRYVESRLAEKARSYHLVAVEDADYLAATLWRARNGATIEQLAAALVDEEIPLDDARAYTAQLIESQILVPGIALNVSGPEPIHPLIEQLRERAETAEIAATLERARADLASIDRTGLGIEPERYLSLARSLESLPVKIELSRLLQVDLTKPAPAATLGTAVLDELVRGVDLMRRLFRKSPEGLLQQFREAFVARYEGREAPLVEALDEEMGVGFGASDETAPLLKDLHFPPEPEESRVSNERRHELLLRKLCEAQTRGAQEITLTPEEIEAVSDKDALPLPDAFAVTARLSAATQEALDAGRFQLLIESVGGPSGATLLGRFCCADETLHKNVLSHLREEEALQPEAVFAEIVHLPEGRIGNIISRPVLRAFEIPYLGRSGAKAERQIPISDLHVSVRKGRIRLRSARLNAEVIPRLTNAHNYVWNSLGIYKFLCMLSQQGVAGGLAWDWGALSLAPFLPRVTIGRLVLSLARWQMSKDELRALNEPQGAARYRAIQKWRAARNLPRVIMLADGDNLLPIDFDNALSVESFIQLIKERERAKLVEMFPAPDQLCAHGPEGAFVHELVVPFVRSSGVRGRGSGVGEKQELPTPSPRPLTPVQRRFPPGSEWLYAKLYTGTATADVLLREVARPVVDSLMQTGAVDSWFFIRYGDPEWHLRLRFQGRPEKLQRVAMPLLNLAFSEPLNDGRAWRVQLDTYEREVERYGGATGIELAERIFHADSEAALEIIEMLEPGDAGADERWRLTLYGIDLLLADLGFDLETKQMVVKDARDGLAREFRADKNLWAQLRMRSRAERRDLTELLRSDSASAHPLAPGLEILHRRSKRFAPVIAELKAHAQAGHLTATLQQLAQSYAHLHANRLLRSAQRQQELVIYDLLARLYESQIARGEKNSSP